MNYDFSRMELSRKIAKQRVKLARAYKKYNSLTHDEVIKESQELDFLIIEYYKIHGLEDKQ